jgi:hypothetical protein
MACVAVALACVVCCSTDVILALLSLFAFSACLAVTTAVTTKSRTSAN